MRIRPTTLLLLTLVVAACATDDDADSPAATPTMDAGAAMEHADADMLAMAEEADSLAAAARASAAALRELAPAEAQPRMPEHATIVEELIECMERYLMAMEGMHDDDAEHAEMRGRIATLREEAAVLRGATADRIREVLPAHLDRLDTFVGHVERSASHMRAGHHGMDHGAH
jgi:hypothetical protein